MFNFIRNWLQKRRDAKALARLKEHAIKWVQSKTIPAIYGDKVPVNVSAAVDLGAALAEAASRRRAP